MKATGSYTPGCFDNLWIPATAFTSQAGKDDMKTIKCNRGKVALVDDEMFDELNQYEWKASPGGYTWYACRYVRRDDGKFDSVSLHREVARLAGFPPSKYIDHRDRNGLNNQVSNLRPATGSQNACNQRLSRSNTSGYRGVAWHPKRGKWVAAIHHGEKIVYLGGFDSKETAARIYDVKAVELRGEFAQLNFPDTLSESLAAANAAPRVNRHKPRQPR